jgi:hypothetical protein
MKRLIASIPVISEFFIRRFVESALDECAATYPLFRAFYHIACMHSPYWQPVVEEQAALFASVGITPVACVIGSPADVKWVESKGIVVQSRHDGFANFETPTLQALWEWCRENPTGIALYAHTKGVSRPHDRMRVAWRQLMDLYVIHDWRENVDKLKDLDAVGVDWLERGLYSHFAGTFMMARADWIARLPSPWVHRRDERRPGDPGWDRLHAELWANCRPGIRTESLGCPKNKWIWGGKACYQLLAEKRRMIAVACGTSNGRMANDPTPFLLAMHPDAVERALRRHPNAAIRRRLRA